MLTEMQLRAIVPSIFGDEQNERQPDFIEPEPSQIEFQACGGDSRLA